MLIEFSLAEPMTNGSLSSQHLIRSLPCLQQTEVYRCLAVI
jgi:hypothetical protein